MSGPKSTANKCWMFLHLMHWIKKHYEPLLFPFKNDLHKT